MPAGEVIAAASKPTAFTAAVPANGYDRNNVMTDYGVGTGL